MPEGLIGLAVLLAQVCTAEVDLGVRPEAAETRECQLMWSVLATRVGDLDPTEVLGEVARSYPTVFRCEGRRCDRPRLRMARSLDAWGNRPAYWDPKAGPWERYRPAWLRRVDAARQWLLGGLRWPRDASPGCRAATHFGGRCAAHGACDRVPACWRLAPCGDTAQAYWVERRCSAGAGVIDAAMAAARR